MAAAANDNPLVDAPSAIGGLEGTDGTAGMEVLPGAEGRPAEADGVHG